MDECSVMQLHIGEPRERHVSEGMSGGCSYALPNAEQTDVSH